jgi:hypothetical protein
VLEEITHVSLALRSASKALEDGREVVQATAQTHGRAFPFVTEERWRDRAGGLEEVAQAGLALRSASKGLEGDREAHCSCSRSWDWSTWMQMFVRPGGFYLRLERAELMLCSSG